MKKVIDRKLAKAEKKRRDYAALVLKTYDRFEHADKREVLDRAAEVNAKSKETL